MLKLKKCKMFTETINYCDHGIRIRCISLARHTTDAVVKFEHRTTQTVLQLYRRLCNVFRGFDPNFGHNVAPFNKTLMRDQPKQLGSLDEKNSATVVS